MQRMLVVTAVVTVVLTASIAVAGTTSPAPAHSTAQATRGALVHLHNQDGDRVGRAVLTQRGDAVQVAVAVHHLPPGFHGFHVHEVGQCTPPFTSAGGHFNSTQQSHAHHAGDMPVLLVNANGTAQTSFPTDRFRVNDLVDTNGSALIIHANPDNYANIPRDRYDPDPDALTLATGDAGDRIACGVIQRQ
ncbi:MAG: superoxide dismutase family protein [Chloroflexota bacterium]|nr:superoxide dismutase family protein [Chloroflexota bacterium]